MPTDTKVGNPRAGAHGKTPNQKGKPLGIPKWGWIVGIALGLVIGYLVLKHSGSSSGSSSDTGSGPDSSPLGNSGTGSGGGASSGSPSNSDMLAARGITNIGTSDPGSVGGQGDSSTSTNPTYPMGALANSMQDLAAQAAAAQAAAAARANAITSNPQFQASPGGNIGNTAQIVASQSGQTTVVQTGTNVRTPGHQME